MTVSVHLDTVLVGDDADAWAGAGFRVRDRGIVVDTTRIECRGDLRHQGANIGQREPALARHIFKRSARDQLHGEVDLAVLSLAGVMHLHEIGVMYTGK